MASGGAGELGGEGGGIASALQAIADQPMQTTGVPDLRGWKLPDGKLVIPFQCLDPGRINTRAIRPLPKQAQFKPVGKRGERYL